MIDPAEMRLHSQRPISSCSAPVRLAQDIFIRDWMNVGMCLGFTHTTAEVHALLYICGWPQCTDDVMARLDMSRGNVSMCLRTLQDWGVVRRLHLAGDRKDYFESLANIGDVFRAVVSNRIVRLINPALTRIRQSKAALSETASGYVGDQSSFKIICSRLDDIETFIISMNAISQQLIEKAAPLPQRQVTNGGGNLAKNRARRANAGDIGRLEGSRKSITQLPR